MNQAELVAKIKELSTAVPISLVQIKHVLETTAEITQAELAKGGEVTLPGIGKLTVSERAARTGRNPRTGEEIAIPEKKVPHFSALKALKDAVAA